MKKVIANITNLVRLAAIGTAATAGLLASASPASAVAYGDPTCRSSRPAVSPQSTFQAFALHRLIVQAKVCKILGPANGFTFVAEPSISLPTLAPGGGVLEEVSLTAGPTLTVGGRYEVVYRFSVKQETFKIAGSQTFTFDTTYQNTGSTYRVRTCFVNGGGGCSNWTNF